MGLLRNALSPYVRCHRIGELLPSPADIEIERGGLVQPDLLVYRIPAEGIVTRDWPVRRALQLAIEVLSPATARYDRGPKRCLCLRSPVNEYWIVGSSRAWWSDGGQEGVVAE